MKRIGVILILLLAFCGLADSAYVAQHEAVGCVVGGVQVCAAVAQSPYTHFFGVSFAQYGVLFYGILFVLAALELVVGGWFMRRVLQSVAFVGFLGALYSLVMQLFFINVFCIYCVLSVLLTILVFLSALMLEPMRRRKNTPPQVAPFLRMPPQ